MGVNSIKKIFNLFTHNQTYKSHIALTSGHINDTYKIETLSGNNFVLQRINTDIFPNVGELVDSKINVSRYLKRNSSYKVSDYIKTESDSYFKIDLNGDSWTLSTFIKETAVFSFPENRQIARESGKLLADFHKSIKGYDVSTLFEIIPNFHNLAFRRKQFEDAVSNASKELLENAKKEIAQIEAYREDAEYLNELKASGKLPLRVVHNDAKLSNMLFDKNTLLASAIIDFDTIMPGIIHYDIGDAIRSVCASVNENEADISKIDFNIDFYKAFLEGFLSIIGSELTDLEKETIPLSIKYMLYEQSLRFSTDYLNGNTYYKVDYSNHNLVRTKNQLKLLKIVNERYKEIKEITSNLLAMN